MRHNSRWLAALIGLTLSGVTWAVAALAARLGMLVLGLEIFLSVPAP